MDEKLALYWDEETGRGIFKVNLTPARQVRSLYHHESIDPALTVAVLGLAELGGDLQEELAAHRGQLGRKGCR